MDSLMIFFSSSARRSSLVSRNFHDAAQFFSLQFLWPLHSLTAEGALLLRHKG
jgi:hypothetical protein